MSTKEQTKQNEKLSNTDAAAQKKKKRLEEKQV